ncbi:MAG: SRPBCC family protein [Microthrixaceae bacterium]
MDVTAALVAKVTPDAMYRVVSDLGRYPQWLDIVAKAVPDEAVATDPGPAWIVDLRGQLGPLRRSKRLRMTRAVADEPHVVRFERAEIDGRSHSDWVLQAVVISDGFHLGRPGSGAPGPGSSDSGDPGSREAVTLEMSLHYGGSMWIPLLDRLLSDEIGRSRDRLLELLAQQS